VLQGDTMKKLALITTVVLAVLTVAASPTGAVDDVERDALMALYNSTDGANWIQNDGWDTEDPYCSWDGVSCGLNYLGALVLLNNNLNGPIPAELGNLSSLGYLDLRNNQLSGPIPAELGKLSSLVGFWLNNNQLSGPIPAELGNLSSLGVLWLNDNQLSGPIPAELGNLSSLVGLWLNNNQLNGPIPSELSNLSNLLWLDLHNNQLTGPIPAKLSNLSSLEELYLNFNPSLVCWQSEAALMWAQGLPEYAGPETYCSFAYLPLVVSDGG